MNLIQLTGELGLGSDQRRGLLRRNRLLGGQRGGRQEAGEEHEREEEERGQLRHFFRFRFLERLAKESERTSRMNAREGGRVFLCVRSRRKMESLNESEVKEAAGKEGGWRLDDL